MPKSYQQRIRERDLDRCRSCGLGANLHVHHIIFRSHGGPDEDWNLITLCKRCHDAAHGLIKDLHYTKWQLLSWVQFGRQKCWDAVMEPHRAAGKPCEWKHTCLSCEWREKDGCAVFEYQDTAWDYHCDAWILRQGE